MLAAVTVAVLVAECAGIGAFAADAWDGARDTETRAADIAVGASNAGGAEGGDFAAVERARAPGARGFAGGGAPAGRGVGRALSAWVRAAGGGGSAGRDASVPVPRVGRAWPVGVRPLVLRGWVPPATEYGPGHRGVDLAAAPGAPVRAVAAGRVSFAGRVAGRGVVSLELEGTGDPPLRTTYEPVRATVRKGDKVAAGQVLGVLEPGSAHCTEPCLHWGLRHADVYLDPLSLLPPWLLRHGPSRLLPVSGVPEPGPTARRPARVTSATHPTWRPVLGAPSLAPRPNRVSRAPRAALSPPPRR